MPWKHLLLLTAGLLLLLSGCADSRPAPGPLPRATEPAATPRSSPAPQPAPLSPVPQKQPTAPIPPPAPTPPPAEPAPPNDAQAASAATKEPVEPAEASAAEPAEETPDEPADGRLPPYVRILRAGPGARQLAHVDVTTRAPSTLEITTRDVRRLWVGRRELPVGRNGRVILRIDGQVFEWSRRHDSLVLEFTPNGAWEITERTPED